ncbi:MAG: sensor histidine kinase [Desulfuromonadales bacterium]
MKKGKDPSSEAAELRRRAEARLKGQAPAVDLSRSDTEAQRLLHELQVHQIELEMQNTELRQARDQAEKALEKYSDLYDFAPIGYFTLDREGVISAANVTGATLLGIERSRLVGRRFGLFVSPETRPAFTAFLARVFAHQAKEACEMPLQNEGKPRLFAQIEAVASASGQECRAAIIDISMRRKLEETLEILHIDLAARVTELETANIELEAFNYSVSHDLRGPLTIIAGYCDVIADLDSSELEEKGREFIRQMQVSALYMNRLIDTLLNFSSVKRVAICHEAVDLSSLAEEIALRLKATAPERQVRFQIAAGITAGGDAGLLRMVLGNLIGNAWKFSGKKNMSVIEFGETAIDGKPAYFVRDNGPGFDMALADKLFLPFQRLPGTDVEGHGIGLATVDRIVRRHGGRIWAESRSNAGATFYFTLG